MGNRNDVAKLLSVFDVFLFPSHYEGLGIVCIEAMSVGLPVVASDQVPVKNITGELKKISLSENNSVWADALMAAIYNKLYDRTDINHTVELITKSGYNITREADKLQKFYLSCCNNLVEN